MNVIKAFIQFHRLYPWFFFLASVSDLKDGGVMRRKTRAHTFLEP